MIGFVKGFGRFWWDFIIGEDWKIAAGVAIVLTVGALLVAGTELSDAAIALLCGAGVGRAASVGRAAQTCLVAATWTQPNTLAR